MVYARRWCIHGLSTDCIALVIVVIVNMQLVSERYLHRAAWTLRTILRSRNSAVRPPPSYHHATGTCTGIVRIYYIWVE